MSKKQLYLIIALLVLSVCNPLLSQAMTVGPPHEGVVCNTCHGEGGLNAIYGRAPQCLNCHNSNSVAKKMPFAMNDTSRLFNFTSHQGGASENNSHAWGVPLEEGRAGATVPPEKAGTYVSDKSRAMGKLSCPSCHSGHENSYRAMLRGPYDI
ncbi:MAG: hypothetical protein OEV42_21385, partial [Deltaproteobacteria bacterium]|nr:hypothetical protein [Deltaproteobacteria bacterium]